LLSCSLALYLDSPAFDVASFLLSPNPIGPRFRSQRGRSRRGAQNPRGFGREIGAIRGNLWASAAFTDARFMGTEGLTSFDRKNSEQLAQAKANAEKALALAPIEWRGMGSFWPCFRRPAGCREPPRHASRNVLFHRTECTGARTLAASNGRQPQARSRTRTSRNSSKAIFGRFCNAGRNFNKPSLPPIAALAAESAYFRISCCRRRFRAAQSPSLRPAKLISRQAGLDRRRENRH